MHKLDTIKNIYFIGIGGIGMSALARYFVSKGCVVSGYDKTETALTKSLSDIGIQIHYEDSLDLIDKNASVVVYTPAIPASHHELNYYRDNGYEVVKRSDVLGWITEGTTNICVAGTHGKTTVSTMIAHILRDSGYGCSAFLGGIAANYNTNFWSSSNNVVVVEADEYDRSFLKLSPSVAVITSMDADHLDIYGDTATIEASFIEFANKITDKSQLFISNELPIEGVTCAVNQEAIYTATNIRIMGSEYVFDVKTSSETIVNIKFGLPGKHNLMNALMALAMAKTFGLPNEDIASALFSFKGIKRRFSYQIKTEKLVYIDDYAHHPTEINAVHQAVRELYPDKKVLAIFQPHLFSRTNDFADDFAKSLAAFDEIILLDIYPARELPMPGITSQWLLEKINNSAKKLITKEMLIPTILQSDATVIVTIGAGDIGELVPSIKKALNETL